MTESILIYLTVYCNLVCAYDCVALAFGTVAKKWYSCAAVVLVISASGPIVTSSHEIHCAALW